MKTLLVLQSKIVVQTLLVLAVCSAMVTEAAACPGCKDGFASGPNAGLGEAYSWSILFMLGVPATIVTVFTIVIVRRLKQNSNS